MFMPECVHKEKVIVRRHCERSEAISRLLEWDCGACSERSEGSRLG